MNQKSELATQKLNELINELQSFYSMPASEAWERIKRWKNRATRVIAELVNESEARKFSDEEVRWSNVDPDVTVDNNIQEQCAFLKGLSEELSRYPEDFFGSAVPTRTPGTPLDSTFDAAFRLIHPVIVDVTKSKFCDGHYSDAAETAIKAVNTRVKAYVKSKIGKEKDGVDLMRTALSPSGPIITFGDLSTETGKNIQQGYMEIFSGSISAIRNPKAHEIINIDAARAIHFLFVASLEMHKLDEAGVP